MGRPEAEKARRFAMGLLAGGLSDADYHENALSVQEAELATVRRLGVPVDQMLIVQANLAMSYEQLGKHDQTLRMRQDVYFGRLKLLGEEHLETLRAANNCAFNLTDLKRFEEAKALMRKTMPVARRVYGEGNRLTLKMRWIYAAALCMDPGATLDDIREAVTTLDDVARIARRVLGGAHPSTERIEVALRKSRAAHEELELFPPEESEAVATAHVVEARAEGGELGIDGVVQEVARVQPHVLGAVGAYHKKKTRARLSFFPWGVAQTPLAATTAPRTFWETHK